MSKPLTDDCLMPFGKHKDKTLKDTAGANDTAHKLKPRKKWVYQN